jgi:hypothetical protein
MKVFLASITIFNNYKCNILTRMKKPKVFKTETLAEIYVANQIFKMLIEMKNEINNKLSSTDVKQYETPYVNKEGIVDIKYKDDLNIMLILRDKLLSSDVCVYLIDYDIDEEDVIE